MAPLDRRSFLTGAGLAVGLGACRPGRDPYAPEPAPGPLPAGTRLGAERHVRSTCGLCPAGCGIRVRVVDGRAVKIDGNPEAPLYGGGLCARGLAGLEMLYHADRVSGPMRRRGNRGDEQWEAVSWADAIAEVAGRLARLRDGGAAHGLLLLDGEAQGTTHALWERFMAAFASPNHVGHGATGRAAVAETVRVMTGQEAWPSYDFAHAGCVLLVGTGALESSSQAMALSAAMGAAARPRLVCLSPRLPRGAALVDDWLPIGPGEAGRVLLGVLHVLLRDNLVAAAATAHGLQAVREMVMAGHSPAQVAHATGLASDRIEALARGLLAARPSVVVVDEETKERRAVAAALWLNALLATGTTGGMRLAPAEPPRPSVASAPAGMPALDGGEPGQQGFASSRMLAVPDAILSGKPYPVEVLLLYHSNPVFSKPDGQRWSEAIARVPFVVSFSPVRDESVRGADLVLPDLSYLEHWDIVMPQQGMLSLRQPVVAPAGQGMQTGEVVLRIAQALGGRVAAALPWASLREAALARLGDLAEASDLLGELESKGWVAAPLPAKAERPAAPLVDLAPLLAETAVPMRDPVEYPFTLWPFRDRGYAPGGARTYPWLSQLPCASRSQLEMSPEDARKLGIDSGDWVRVTSPAGSAELKVQIHGAIKPGVLGLSLGGWGRTVGDLDGMPVRLLLADADPVTGQWLAWATRARIERLG